MWIAVGPAAGEGAMTQNIGEELVGQYLLFCIGCDFVAYNVDTRDVQGEIDVVATKVSGRRREIYLCEVAIHLETGLQYVRDGKSANVVVLVKKFQKDIRYAQKYFPDYVPVPMLWTPIVRGAPRGGKIDQLHDVETIKERIDNEFDTDLQLICNSAFFGTACEAP